MGLDELGSMGLDRVAGWMRWMEWDGWIGVHGWLAWNDSIEKHTNRWDQLNQK